MGLYFGYTICMKKLSGLIGNILDHYDSALFGLLAPFIACLFFDAQDPVSALILTYCMLPLGIVSRPLGALFFGRIGDLYGRRQALFYSLLGMAVVTAAIGFLPLYRDIGWWAPVCLAGMRLLQGFLAAGETTGGAIFVLEHTEATKRSFMSSVFDASSMVGILIASGLVAWLSSHELIETGWRALYWGGGVTALLGIYLRLRGTESREFVQSAQRVNTRWLDTVRKHKKALGAIVVVSGFTYTTYALSVTLMNGYVPLVTTLTKSEVMKINTFLHVADMLLLPFFGWVAERFGKEKLMLVAAVCATATAAPLFSLLDHSSWGTVTAIRLVIITLGVAFAAPYHAWTLEQVPPEARYTILSLGRTLGSQLIGAPTSALCLWLYQQTGWCFSPGIYLAAIGCAASYLIYRRYVAAISKRICKPT